MELKAIDQITNILKNDIRTKAEILPLKIINKTDRNQNQEVSEAYQRLLKKDFIGSQYDWLGVFALEHRGIELCVHKDDKAINIIEKYGCLKKESDYYTLDQEKSDPDLNIVFGNYHFPLADLTKLQMKQWYIENEYASVMNETWFCYQPLNGKPCGLCNPCKYTIEEGLSNRFTKTALLRYYLHHSQVSNMVKKIVKHKS